MSDDQYAIADDPGPDPATIAVPVIIEQPQEDHERALPQNVELHVIEDAAVRFENHSAWILEAIAAESRHEHGAHEADLAVVLNERMPPTVTRHLLAYMGDLGLVIRRGIRGQGVFWKRAL
jgi:hypothetical protein